MSIFHWLSQNPQTQMGGINAVAIETQCITFQGFFLLSPIAQAIQPKIAIT